ncbi:MAG: TlpA family protein disulfide reductase [Prolixibacteraceae bacterium]|nr:TlpA family protein disulfide reductase [Prolixibacteraceae bacterium]
MKRKFATLIFILSIILIGCAPKHIEKDSHYRTVICGKIQHLEVYPTTKEIFTEVIDFRDRKSVFKDSIQKDGTFKIVFDLYAIQDIKMRPLLGRLILHPGDSLFVLLDFSDLNKVQFSGDRAESNQYLRNYLWSNAGSFSFYSPDKIVPGAYKTYCDSVRNAAIIGRNEFVQSYKPTKEIEQWTADFIKIKYFNSIVKYPLNYFARNIEGYKAFVDTSSYFEFTSSIETSFADFGESIINSDIYEFLNSYENYFIQQLLKNQNKQDSVTFRDVSIAMFNIQNKSVFQQMLIGNLFYQMLCSNYTALFDSTKSQLDSSIIASFIKEPLFDYYANVKRNIENPEFASNAIISKMGVDGKNLLDSIIKENRGKVLFVDLWATWCGPCLEGMKASKEIMPRYKNKDIEFIFLCVNSKEENWKATLSKFKIEGKHYFCSNEQSKDIRRALGVEGIPHYLIINKKGNIVESKSQDLARSLNKIDKLLKEKSTVKR